MKFKILYLISIIILTSNLFSDMRIYVTGDSAIEKAIKKGFGSVVSTSIHYGQPGGEQGISDIKSIIGAKIGDNYISIPSNYISKFDRDVPGIPITSIEFKITQDQDGMYKRHQVNERYGYMDGSFKFVLYEDVLHNLQFTAAHPNPKSYPVRAYLAPYNPEKDKQKQEARAAAPARQEQQEQKEQVRKSENHPAARAQADDPAGDKSAKKIAWKEEEYNKDPKLAEAIRESLKTSGVQFQQQQQAPK